jgi:hypothetical protein
MLPGLSLVVCVETTCYPSISDPDKLPALLVEAATGAAGAESAP